MGSCCDDLVTGCCGVPLLDGRIVCPIMLEELRGLLEEAGAVVEEAEAVVEPVRNDAVEVLLLMSSVSWGGEGLPLTVLLMCSIISPMLSLT